MSNIYDQIHAAFKNINAYAVLDTRTGNIVATVNAKSTNARTQAFVHWIGIKPYRGTASGGG